MEKKVIEDLRLLKADSDLYYRRFGDTRGWVPDLTPELRAAIRELIKSVSDLKGLPVEAPEAPTDAWTALVRVRTYPSKVQAKWITPDAVSALAVRTALDALTVIEALSKSDVTGISPWEAGVYV